MPDQSAPKRLWGGSPNSSATVALSAAIQNTMCARKTMATATARD